MSKILSIAWYKVLPPKYGGQKGIALFTKYLSAFHDIVFLCSKNNEQAMDMPFEINTELPDSKSQFLNPFCWRKIIRITKNVQPSYIIIEHPYHGIAGYLAAKKTQAKLVVHSHNIESQRFKEIGKWGWSLLSKYERWIFRRADLNLFKTEKDLQWAIRHFGIERNKGFVVPYGIEKNTPVDKIKAKEIICNKYGLAEKVKILLFAGTLDYKPNAKAVELIFKEIAPRLSKQNDHSFKILICGRNHLQRFQYLKQLIHPDVLYVGEVEDIENYFAGADIFLNPVQTGGGIQSKIIEALKYNLNVVCFSEQADDQLIKLTGEKIFTNIAGNYNEMVENISSAVEKNSPTPPAFFEYYDWSNIVRRFNEKLQESFVL